MMPKYTDKYLNNLYERGGRRLFLEQGREYLPSLYDSIDRGKLVRLEGEYLQDSTWEVGRRSALIESFLLNIPVPPITYYSPNSVAPVQVVDGWQRLATVAAFFKNEFALSGLVLWSGLNGFYYRDLPAGIKASLGRCRLTTSAILNDEMAQGFSPELIIRTTYERLNQFRFGLESPNPVSPRAQDDIPLTFCSTPDIDEWIEQERQDKEDSIPETDGEVVRRKLLKLIKLESEGF